MRGASSKICARCICVCCGPLAAATVPAGPGCQPRGEARPRPPPAGSLRVERRIGSVGSEKDSLGRYRDRHDLGTIAGKKTSDVRTWGSVSPDALSRRTAVRASADARGLFLIKHTTSESAAQGIQGGCGIRRNQPHRWETRAVQPGTFAIAASFRLRFAPEVWRRRHLLSQLERFSTPSQGAWLARLGFLAFGLAVIWLATASDLPWARAVVWLHLSFGVLMLSTAAFSHWPWVAGVPFDPVEEGLHSFTATAIGFAFALGVLLRLFQRRSRHRLGRILDVTALASATVIPC